MSRIMLINVVLLLLLKFKYNLLTKYVYVLTEFGDSTIILIIVVKGALNPNLLNLTTV